MAKSSVEEGAAAAAAHPYHFIVSGPRNLIALSWRDLIHSSWKDPNYRRTVIACFVQAAYLLELDRQEKKKEGTGLAHHWWKPFKYKLTQTLVDAKDGSIYGAVFEWDRSAAVAALVLARPRGAPKAVLALRGTLLRSATIRRDVHDDLRFFALESLKGSVPFSGALEAAQSAVARFGGPNVCIGGHSLGAGFALQIGKALAKQGMFVDCHLFNPPSVSLASSLKIAGEKARFAFKRLKPSPAAKEAKKDRWLPNLYVNNSDYICCYYNSAGTATNEEREPVAKMFVVAKGPQKFLKAHGLQQWWSDDLDLDAEINHSKLIERQLRSLYTGSHPDLSANSK